MDTESFRVWGKYMVDYICKYLDELSDRRVIPDVEPGYLAPLLPKNVPENPEQWPDVFRDVDQFILPGLTHWQHPRFHAYFASGNSFPSVMGEMLSSAIASIGFSWAASPALTELEIVTVDWMAKLMGLPKSFLHSEGPGGGVIQSSASDSILLSMIAARYAAIEGHREIFASAGDRSPDHAVLSRLVAYSSELAHSSTEKAGMITFCQMRQLSVDKNLAVTGDVLRAAIEEDKKRGLIPFYVCATLGSTAVCSFDDLESIGKVCDELNIWLHVDAAYAGSAFICPEFRTYLNGVEHACSMNFNPNKWLLTNFDCSIFWVRDKDLLTKSMTVDPVYLQHKHSSKAVDFRHWGIPLSRRFRSLKLWFVLRIYGATGLRAYIRNHCTLAKLFEQLVLEDDRFEVIGKVTMGLVCFRLKGSNSLTQCLIRAINESGELHMVPSMVQENYVIRFVVVREGATEDDIHHAWKVIRAFAEEIVTAQASLRQWHRSMRRKRSKARLVGTLTSPAVTKLSRGLADAGSNSKPCAEEDKPCLAGFKQKSGVSPLNQTSPTASAGRPGQPDLPKAEADNVNGTDGTDKILEQAATKSNDNDIDHSGQNTEKPFVDHDASDEETGNEDDDPTELTMASVLANAGQFGIDGVNGFSMAQSSTAFTSCEATTLEDGELDDEDIIQLAEARLATLQKEGSIEAYNLLARQMHTMGITHVPLLDAETGEPIHSDQNLMNPDCSHLVEDSSNEKAKSESSERRNRRRRVNAAGTSFELNFVEQRRSEYEEMMRHFEQELRNALTSDLKENDLSSFDDKEAVENRSKEDNDYEVQEKIENKMTQLGEQDSSEMRSVINDSGVYGSSPKSGEDSKGLSSPESGKFQNEVDKDLQGRGLEKSHLNESHVKTVFHSSNGGPIAGTPMATAKRTQAVVMHPHAGSNEVSGLPAKTLDNVSKGSGLTFPPNSSTSSPVVAQLVLNLVPDKVNSTSKNESQSTPLCMPKSTVNTSTRPNDGLSNTEDGIGNADASEKQGMISGESDMLQSKPYAVEKSYIDQDSQPSRVICEQDLGIGRQYNTTLTRLRRQTLLRMISDPSSTNKPLFRHKCTCGRGRRLVSRQRRINGLTSVLVGADEDPLEEYSELNDSQPEELKKASLSYLGEKRKDLVKQCTLIGMERFIEPSEHLEEGEAEAGERENVDTSKVKMRHSVQYGNEKIKMMNDKMSATDCPVCKASSITANVNESLQLRNSMLVDRAMMSNLGGTSSTGSSLLSLPPVALRRTTVAESDIGKLSQQIKSQNQTQKAIRLFAEDTVSPIVKPSACVPDSTDHPTEAPRVSISDTDA